MVIPDEFKRVCRQFDQDVHLVFTSRETMIHDMINSALDLQNKKQLEVVKSFLDELLSGRHSDEELQRIWFETPADIYFPDRRQLVEFLAAMRELTGARLHRDHGR